MTDSKPNFLFIQADQLAAAYLGCYGNTVVDAPAIDSLAQSGVVFDRAYTNFPLCAPSRFSMLSGKLASSIAAYDNGAEFTSSTPTFIHHLRALGYQTCLSGKMHFVGADQLHGFESRLTTDIYPSDFGWTGDWTEVAMGQSNNDSTFTGAGVCLRNPQMEYDEEVVHRAIRKLYDIARRRDTRPFMLTVSMSHPHDPYQCLQTHWDRYQHDDIDPPRVGMLSEDQTDPYSKRLKAQYGLYDSQPDEQTIQIARHAYYGSISYLDAQIGKILSVLDKTGLSDNTVVVFTSDHGDMLGERGLWYKKCFYENSIRVPLIIKAPSHQAGRVNHNVSLIDLFPTILNYVDDSESYLQVDNTIEGKSLHPWLSNNDLQMDDVVYAENLAEGACAAILMVKRGQMKYTVSGIDPEQLFDLNVDPLELNNLIEDAAYSEVRDSLRQLAQSRWDVNELGETVQNDQRQRLFVASALKQGQKTTWDYEASDQSEDECLRPPVTYNQWAYDEVLGLSRPKLED